MDFAEGKDGMDRIQLYFYPGTRAVRARWMLEELSVSYDLIHIDLRRGAHKSDEYLAVHPLGKVPALRIDGVVIFESLAICLYLGDRYWEHDLAPVPEERTARADYYKWMAFSTGTLEPAVSEMKRVQICRDRGVEVIAPGPALTPFDVAAGYLDATLAVQPFLLGDQFTAADLMNGAVMMGAGEPDLLSEFQHIQRWIDRLQSRAGYLRAKANELA